MKLLSDILEDVQILDTHGNVDVSISDISLSNKNIQKHSLFAALPGTVTDGHIFIHDAIEKGATVIVYQNDLADFQEHVTYVRVPDTKEALGRMADNFYDNPSRKLKLVGVTGTNGKTTIATLLHQLFRNLGHKAGMIGTVVNKINDESFEAIRTTPDQVSLNKLLAQMVDAGCEYCFMEVSSHAVSEKRIAGLSFAGGIFTNLTLDHLDYHKTFEAYRDAKKAFFDSLPASAFILSNVDDPNGEYMYKDAKADTYVYSLKSVELGEGKPIHFTDRLETKLIGEFNSYNVLAVYGAATLLGQDKEKVKEAMKDLEPAEGRFQYFKNDNGVTGIIDYAHTPDALENVLKTVNNMKEDGKVIAVVGCGGDRDKSKRPIMAKIAYYQSDIAILTSDNPRTEDPNDILQDMKKGIEGLPHENVFIIADRREAIQKACLLAEPGDYVLVAGKGHEKYQEINGMKSHFDDIEELKKYLLA